MTRAAVIALAAVGALGPAAAACPLCDGGAAGGNPVRAEVFGPGFWGHAAAVAAPFAVMLALSVVLSRQPTPPPSSP